MIPSPKGRQDLSKYRQAGRYALSGQWPTARRRGMVDQLARVLVSVRINSIG